jgi:hypothetical protein
MGSKPGRSDVLLALRMLVDKVSQGLGSMTGERVDSVSDGKVVLLILYPFCSCSLQLIEVGLLEQPGYVLPQL